MRTEGQGQVEENVCMDIDKAKVFIKNIYKHQ